MVNIGKEQRREEGRREWKKTLTQNITRHSYQFGSVPYGRTDGLYGTVRFASVRFSDLNMGRMVCFSAIRFCVCATSFYCFFFNFFLFVLLKLYVFLVSFLLKTDAHIHTHWFIQFFPFSFFDGFGSHSEKCFDCKSHVHVHCTRPSYSFS